MVALLNKSFFTQKFCAKNIINAKVIVNYSKIYTTICANFDLFNNAHKGRGEAKKIKPFCNKAFCIKYKKTQTSKLNFRILIINFFLIVELQALHRPPHNPLGELLKVG